MRVLGAYEKARIYIEQHTELSEEAKLKIRKLNPGPTITISRETGIGAEKICEKLITFIQNYSKLFKTIQKKSVVIGHILIKI